MEQRKSQKSFVNRIIRGAMILIPIIGAIYFFNSLNKTISEQIEKIIVNTPLETKSQVIFVAIISLILIVLFTYFIGYLSQLRPIRQFARWLDEQLIDNSEAYRSFKLNLDNNTQFITENRPPVFVRFGESERPGFLMEEYKEQGKCIVFIPKRYSTFNGNIFIVDKKNVRYAASSAEDFIFSLEHLGEGLNIK